MNVPSTQGHTCRNGSAAEEVTNGFGRRTAPDHVNVYSPAFDVTPNNLITAIITDRGIIQPVTTDTVHSVVSS